MKPDHEQQYPATNTEAWTPGPRVTDWYPDVVGKPLVCSVATPIDGTPVHVARAYDIDPACWEGVGTTDANAALIALAPEMAGVLMSMADEWDAIWKRPPGPDDAQHKWYALAARLRKIGAPDA